MTPIAELIDPGERKLMWDIAGRNPLAGEPYDESECRRWMRWLEVELETLRIDREWGLQHGREATEGFYFWFRAIETRQDKARARFTDLRIWLDECDNAPIKGPRRLRRPATRVA